MMKFVVKLWGEGFTHGCVSDSSLRSDVCGQKTAQEFIMLCNRVYFVKI